MISTLDLELGYAAFIVSLCHEWLDFGSDAPIWPQRGEYYTVT